MIKKIIAGLFHCLISAAYWSYRIEGVNALLLIMPAKLVVPTLRRFGATVGEEVIMHSPLVIHNAGENYSKLTIGNKCYFGREVLFDLKDKIVVGDRVTLSMRTTLITHTDVGKSSLQKVITPSRGSIQIEADAYLGANVTVLQGIHIGEGAVIGAGSVVLNNVPAKMLAAGNPAKVIKSISE